VITDGDRAWIELGWSTAWMHEARNTHGEWTHGSSLPSAPRSAERHGYKGRFEGYDPLVPSMEAADRRKPLDQPGRPDGQGTPDDPIDVRGDMSRAVSLMADGNHVRLNSPAEIGPLLDEVNRQAAAQGYSRDHEPTWDLGNISVKGTRLFNEQTIGIPRQDMPQLNGPAQPGTEAALLAGGANKFIELDSEFRDALRRDGVDVKNERVPAGNLRATQTQLTAATVAGIAGAAAGGNVKVRHMLKEPIWVSSDNYVIDGHHRWAADEALAFSGHGPKDIEVQRIALPIRLAVPYANAFAQRMGIGGRALGNAKLVEGANTIGEQILDLAGWHDAWRHELRGPDGRWMSGGSRTEQMHLGKILRAAATPFVGAAPHGEEYPGQFSDQIIKYWKNEDNPAAKQELNLAGAEWGSSTSEDHNFPATALHLRNAARLTSDGNKAARYNELAANIETGGQTTAALRDAVNAEAVPASRIVPGLLESHNEIWNGKTKIYPVTEKPKVLAELDWDGTLSVQDQVANALKDARDHPDQPVRFPDAFEVIEHEMVHGVIQPGTERENERAYQDYATAQIEEGFTELGSIHHAPDFMDQMGIGSLQSGTWAGHTVREMAESMQDPAEIANGNSWGHYGQQTKDAQDWVQQVAMEEGWGGDLRPGTPGHQRVVALTDQINRFGASGKIETMATQMAYATVKDERLRSNQEFMAGLLENIENAIRSEWAKGEPDAAKEAFLQAKAGVQRQAVQAMREMQEQAA
jgi:hypothetical protein